MEQRITQLQQKIAEAQKEIEAIRAACPHTDTYEGIYSWRIGNYDWHNICSECGKVLWQVKPYKPVTFGSMELKPYPYDGTAKYTSPTDPL